MNIRSFFFAAGIALILCSGKAVADAAVLEPASKAIQVKSARVVKAPNGAYVTGTAQTSFGYAAPSHPHVHILAYDAEGNLVGEKVDSLSRARLVKSHLNPRARASYVAFFPVDASEIVRVMVVPHARHHHSRPPDEKN